MKLQTPIGDVPVLNKFVKDREEAVRDRYDVVAEQLAQVVLSAGYNFDPNQCGPVKFASGLFEISPVGQVGVMSPNPKMSSRPITVKIDRDDDEVEKKQGLKTPKRILYLLPRPQPVYMGDTRNNNAD